MKERLALAAGDWVKIGDRIAEEDSNLVETGQVLKVIDDDCGDEQDLKLNISCCKCEKSTEHWISTYTEVEYMSELDACKHFARIARDKARAAEALVVLAEEKAQRELEAQRKGDLEQIRALVKKHGIKKEDIWELENEQD